MSYLNRGCTETEKQLGMVTDSLRPKENLGFAGLEAQQVCVASCRHRIDGERFFGGKTE